MSGKRGFLTSTQGAAILKARRHLFDVEDASEEVYNSGLAVFASDLYGSIGLAPPKIYRFASPLASMMALPHLMGLHSEAGGAFLLTDFQNVLSEIMETGPKEAGIDSLLLRSALHLPGEERMSDVFKEAFMRQMKDQCGCNDKKSKELITRSTASKGLDGQDWWVSVSVGRTWVWPYDQFLVASDKPIRKDFDDRGRCHREDDAAIEFSDGYRIWAWHGVLVPKHVILFPEALGFSNVEKEKNLEVRRIMIERIGTGKYLKQAGAVLKDMDALTLNGSAPRALMVDKLGNRWLVGTDGSTARVYTMSVPENANTCKEAHEMICGFDESRLIAEA